MSFSYEKYIPLLLLAFIVFAVINIIFERRYFRWVRTYWFLRRKRLNVLASILYLLGFLLLILSVADLRGPEVKIAAEIPDQKTILIIDTSASMLTEDVRPNRFEKALVMARHFVKKAVGHQISVVLFSDVQKRVVPFTDDLDLLDARIAALTKTNIKSGGSNIKQAIQESLQYFLMVQGTIEGNLLIFTDSEGSPEELELNIPDTVNVAIVGVGTTRGGPIPLRDRAGNLKGYKRHKDEQVISKLDEEFLKKLTTKIKHYRYWVSLSYSIPTEEIVDFFRIRYKDKLAKGEVRLRPVWANYLLLPGVIFLVIAFLLRIRRTFVLLLLCFFQFGMGDAFAATPKDKLLAQLKEGRISKEGRLKLGEYFLRANDAKKALTLYQESTANIALEDERTRFNYATGLLKSGKMQEGIQHLKELNDDLKDKQGIETQALQQAIVHNLFVALNQAKDEGKQQKKSEDKEQDQEGNEQKNKEQDKDQKENKGQDEQQKDEKQQSQGEKSPDKKEEKKEQKQQPAQQKEQQDQQKKNGEKQDDSKKRPPMNLEQKERHLEQRRKQVSIPGVLKQILDGDRDIQKKFIDTQELRKGEQRRDW